MLHTRNYMLGLSGGVDSATTACLLKREGHSVQPVFMHNWDEDDHCHVAEDINLCNEICTHIGLSLDIVSYRKEYFDRVFNTCLEMFAEGLTPNPDILCNNLIKFDLLRKHAQQSGFDGLATGHYADIEKRDGEFALIQAPDPVKDQTYFLSQLTQEQLAYAVFPLGKYTKHETRQLAQSFKLPNADKKDSVGICFVGDRKFSSFLQEYLLTRPGNIITKSGTVVGKHKGLFCYTIGQRKGLGVGGVKDSLDSPWFVMDKIMDTNELVISQETNDLLKRSAKLAPIQWIRQEPHSLNLKAKLRHGPEMIECTLSLSEQPIVTFREAQIAPTPGQHVVFYHDNECLGGSMILETYS